MSSVFSQKSSNETLCWDSLLKKEDFPDLYYIEDVLRESGYSCIVGIDEAGRGPLAGPVVASCVCLPKGEKLDKLNDSKKLTANTRESISRIIISHPDIKVGIGVVSPKDIDRINILQATYIAMKKALDSIAAELSVIDTVLVDGSAVPLFSCRNIVRGDGKCACIAAASVVAKVHRDRIMVKMDRKYPQYGFAKHKGYPTKKHIENLNNYGPCPIHRRSFAPVKAVL